MKKSTRKTLDELAEKMPIICELRQREFVGGHGRDSLMVQHAQQATIDGSSGSGGGYGSGYDSNRAFGNWSPYRGSQFWNPGPHFSHEYDAAYGAAFENAVQGRSYINYVQIVGRSITNSEGDKVPIDQNSGATAGNSDGLNYRDSLSTANRRNYLDSLIRGGGSRGGGSSGPAEEEKSH